MHSNSNPYLVIDVETGGFDPQKNPVTEIGIVALDPNLNQLFTYDSLIKPYDDTLEYGEEAYKITGISKQLCEDKGDTLKDVVRDICTAAKEARQGRKKRQNYPIIVAHNADMENKFLTDMFSRCGVDIDKHFQTVSDGNGVKSFRYQDTMDIAKNIWGHIEGSTSGFSLPACLKKIGVEQIDAHRALPDTEYTAVFFTYAMQKIRSVGQAIAPKQELENKFRETFKF